MPARHHSRKCYCPIVRLRFKPGKEDARPSLMVPVHLTASQCQGKPLRWIGKECQVKRSSILFHFPPSFSKHSNWKESRFFARLLDAAMWFCASSFAVPWGSCSPRGSSNPECHSLSYINTHRTRRVPFQSKYNNNSKKYDQFYRFLLQQLGRALGRLAPLWIEELNRSQLRQRRRRRLRQWPTRPVVPVVWFHRSELSSAQKRVSSNEHTSENARTVGWVFLVSGRMVGTGGHHRRSWDDSSSDLGNSVKGWTGSTFCLDWN